MVFFMGFSKSIRPRWKAPVSSEPHPGESRVFKTLDGTSLFFTAHISWLVVDQHQREILEFVSWDYDNPNMMGKSYIIPWFQTTSNQFHGKHTWKNTEKAHVFR